MHTSNNIGKDISEHNMFNILGLWTGVSDSWEGNKRLGKDFFVEFLQLKLSNTNVVASRIGQ